MEQDLLWHLQELLRRTGWLAEHHLRMDRRLQSMESRLEALEGRLQAAEGRLLSIEQQLAGLEDRPSTRIDKIEYRFEQLKVDTLAGTLQIGLAQGAEGLIEDLAAGQTVCQDVLLTPGEQGEPYVSMNRALEDYMGAELYRDIDDAAAGAGARMDPVQREAVAEDLKSQIRRRSQVYMKEIPAKEGADGGAVAAVLERVRKDVRSGLKVFYQSGGEEQAP